jgi:hypothetical protein
MPVTGRKPKAYHRHRARPAHDWTEVLDVPFEDGPPLPRTQPNGQAWPKAAIAWWDAVSRMPHCVLWKEGDWLFALTTAVIAAAFYRGNLKLAQELRQRERLLGTTADALRDLRIRYVQRIDEPELEGVTAIADYRRRLGA